MPTRCSICGTDNFFRTERGFDLAYSCEACRIVFCADCAGRRVMDYGIIALHCPRCGTLSIVDFVPSEDAT